MALMLPKVHQCTVMMPIPVQTQVAFGTVVVGMDASPRLSQLHALMQQQKHAPRQVVTQDSTAGMLVTIDGAYSRLTLYLKHIRCHVPVLCYLSMGDDGDSKLNIHVLHV